MAVVAVIPVSFISNTSPADTLKLPVCSIYAPDDPNDAENEVADKFWSNVSVTGAPGPTYSAMYLVIVPAVGMIVAISVSIEYPSLFPPNANIYGLETCIDANRIVSPGTNGVCTTYQLAAVLAGAGLALGVTCILNRSPGTNPTVWTESHPCVCAPEIVTDTGESAPFLYSVQVQLAPLPGAAVRFTHKELNVPVVGIRE